MIVRRDGTPPGESTELIQARVTPEEWSDYRALAKALGFKGMGELIRHALAERLAKFRRAKERLRRK